MEKNKQQKRKKEKKAGKCAEGVRTVVAKTDVVFWGVGRKKTAQVLILSRGVHSLVCKELPKKKTAYARAGLKMQKTQTTSRLCHSHLECVLFWVSTILKASLFAHQPAFHQCVNREKPLKQNCSSARPHRAGLKPKPLATEPATGGRWCAPRRPSSGPATRDGAHWLCERSGVEQSGLASTFKNAYSIVYAICGTSHNQLVKMQTKHCVLFPIQGEECKSHSPLPKWLCK